MRSPYAIAAQLPEATVYRTIGPTGNPAINHAKFIIFDRALTLLTGANFLYSA